MANTKHEKTIIAAVAEQFRSCGSGDANPDGNPIAMTLVDRRPKFAGGVDIGDVVHYVLVLADTMNATPPPSDRFEAIREATAKLNALLSDRHPGLTTWHAAVAGATAELNALIEPSLAH
jgi:hypothetical protein